MNPPLEERAFSARCQTVVPLEDAQQALFELKQSYFGGVDLIATERRRQLLTEGWDADHDDAHDDGSLAVTAAALAVHGTDAVVCDPLGRGTPNAHGNGEPGDSWGLIVKHGNDELRRLVIAGALIAAEIDRVLRAQQLRKA